MQYFKTIFTLIILLLSVKSYTQVTVAPVTIHLNDAARNDRIVIYNNSPSTPVEVSVEIKYGYPKSDSIGNTFIYFPESITQEDPSVIKWISFYPKKFVLKPLEEQSVRVAARPPSDLKEGEYWGRPVITSHQVTPPDSTANPEGISVSLSSVFKTVIALNYRHGVVNTSILFPDLTYKIEDNKIVLFCDLKREGNAAFLGNIKIIVKNKAGEIVLKKEQEIAIYYDLHKRIELDPGSLDKGEYNIEVELNTERAGQNEKILPANSITKNINIVY